jgi:5-methylcytosine-specific restriction endonuclease McrA
MKQPVGWGRARPDPRYKTSTWRELARSIVRGRVCVLCGVAPASQADHILGANERPDLFFVRSNLRPVCRSCHAKREAIKSNAKKPWRPPRLHYWVV